MADLVRVPSKLKSDVWPLVADRLRAAYLKNDLSHTADLEHDVLRGEGDLWLATSGAEIEAAAVTVLQRTDKHLVCVITALGGRDRSRWIDLLPAIECFARQQGAAVVRFFGRRGWAAVLDDYRVSAVVMERVL
ncbi:conserved hypothetical protein [Rhodopseudomonas palustris TIE-1]|uniref:hypothetical protein n=1 Tax=Rhodopseudomonas palustris TaxID=1076 RepID=UPI000164A58F|nr:hypothetical protein [Rhodopseudomonas palustris]ACF01574.1 conserved hypothetical protein [Rhodopseudomonas palustris TIE-1]